MRTAVILLCSLLGPAAIRAEQAGSTGRPVGDIRCVRFQSSGRLAAGTPFQADLLLGLEFRLSADWVISVGPKGRPDLDYLWVVSPPLQVAPHRVIGPAYGITARESLQIKRHFRFVRTQAEYLEAVATIEAQTPDPARQLQRLGKGNLSLEITSHQLRDIVPPNGRPVDAFDWITFTGDACVLMPTDG
jgi:hypothetical protein